MWFIMLLTSVVLCSKDTQLPKVVIQTELITPWNYLSYAQPIPHDLKQRLHKIVKKRKSLISRFAGVSKLPYQQTRQETQRLEEILKQKDLVPYPTHHNYHYYAFGVPELPSYVFKFTRPIVRAYNAASQAYHEDMLNEAEAKQSESLYQKLFKYLDDLNAQNPHINLFETYNLASSVVMQKRILQAIDRYQLDRIFVPETYLYVLDAQLPPHDRNAFIVQKTVQGTLLGEPTLLQKIERMSPSKKDLFKKTLQQLYVAMITAKIWNMNDVVITPDLRAAIVDLEKRDRYIKPLIDESESIHLADMALRRMGIILKNSPEFLQFWQGLVRQNPELVHIIKNHRETADLYPAINK